MATVARGHGGDAGGDPPLGPWRPPSKHQSSDVKRNVRRKTTGNKVRDAYTKNGNKPLNIEFDVLDQQTIRPVGPNCSSFTSLVGIEVRKVPPYYATWEDVPQEAKCHIWPEIETYFDMRTHLDGPHSEFITKGVNKLARERYCDHKYTFKRDNFINREGEEHPEEIREYPPENMTSEDWNTYIDFITSTEFKKRSGVNTQNKAKQKYPSLHGTKSYAAYRYDHFLKKKAYPSLIDQFGEMHSLSNGTYVNEVAQTEHEQMLQIKKTQSDEVEILKEVLGERSGHNRGRGRKISGIASTSNTQSQQRMYTQREVDEMLEEKLAAQSQRLDVQARRQEAMYNALRDANIIIPNYPDVSLTDDSRSLDQNEDEVDESD